MKKKLFLVTLMVALFVVAFAVSVSAASNVIKLDKCPTLEEIHANPSTYVSHLDAFDSNSYKDKDANSVVVMSDLQETPTYYVFPTYYILNSWAYSTSVTNLNTALVSYNESLGEGQETVFATYTALGSRGANIHMIRIEIPTYVTGLNGNCKFEGSTNLVEVYFPTKVEIDQETGLEKTVTYVTSIQNQNIFTDCPALKVIHNSKYLPLGIANPAGFSGCSSLESIELPEGVTTFHDYLFDGCSSLKSITIPESVTYVGVRTFRNCKALKEIVFPNSVTTIGKGLFVGCTSLETVNLGAGVVELSGSDNNMEIFTTGNTSLKYVYMPAKFGTVLANTSRSYNSMFSNKNITFFFTGTVDDYNALAEMAGQYSDNAAITGALVEKYDPTKDYEGYAKSVGRAVVAWGYNVCKAFYNNEHKLTENTTISVDSYIEGFDELCICQTCKDITKVNKEQYAPVFVLLGYSAKINGDNICVGYSLNNVSLAKYEELTGKTINFGVVATTVPNGANPDTLEPVNNDLTPMDESTIFANVTSFYASFDFVIKGFSADYYSTELVMCAFVSDGSKVDYICAEGENTAQLEYASTITFDSVAA